MPDDPRLEPRRKLVCRECGYWMFADALLYGRHAKHCGEVMVETYSDQGLLSLDQALSDLGRVIADEFRAIFRR